ncbi:hypothetical protein ACODT5_40175 [Streptomyces sp. 5.8]|uniref:hypothetical protein n=1 Tax=Streptomyces sp. 5.8 TaxID=3406571 RepID=UPI003BB60B65
MTATTKRGATKRGAAKKAASKGIGGGLVATALVLAVAGCSTSEPAGRPAPGAQAAKKGAAAPEGPAPGSVKRLIGDGSTSYTGLQPNVRKAEKLKPGEKPPQFVVYSWDGAGEDSQKLFSHFREVGKKYNARMTYFLSGVYMLPEEKRSLYTAPQHSAGRSDIGFGDPQGIKDTAEQVRGAWLEGNEIGTHFNGHFCGPEGGVGTWSVGEWKSEINQAKSFVKNWKTNSPALKGMEALPFDYDKEMIGARTPCLEGQKNFMLAAKEMGGFRYDSSGISKQIWPKKTDGLWDIPLQLVPMPGRAFETLSMDYNYLVNQSGTTTQGDPSQHAYWGEQMRDGLVKAFERTYQGNRAPLIIGNHFESWNGGTYMRAVEDSIKTMCTQKEVRCVPFRELVDWLDAQDPKALEWMRTLDVGEAPKAGWNTFLTAGPPAKPAAPAGVKPAEEPAGASQNEE